MPKAVGWLLAKLRAITFARWMMVAILVFVAFYEYNQIFHDSIIVDPFTVPKQYEESGWGSQTMTARIQDALDQMEGAAQRQRRDQLALSVDQSSTPDFEVPGTGLGLKTIGNLLRQLLHREARHIGGEIILPLKADPDLSKAQIEITLRSSWGATRSHWPAVYAPASDPQAVAQAAAEKVLEEINPYVLAAYLSMKGENDRAIQVAQSVATDPSKEKQYRAAAYNVWGASLVAKGQFDAAAEKLRESIKLAPNSAVTLNNWGKALEAEGKHEEAVQKFQTAVGMGSKNPVLLHNLAGVLEKQGKHDEAIQTYQDAAQANPSDPRVRTGLAHVLQKTGKLSEAVQQYQKALELQPKDGSAAVGLGSVLQQQGKIGEAQQVIQKAIEVDPANPATYSALGGILKSQGKFAEAKQMFEKAAQVSESAGQK